MHAEVALPLPVQRTWTYRIPEPMRDAARPGVRVLVPFGRRERIGWIDRMDAGEPDPAVTRILPIHGILDLDPTATPEMLELCRWIADYYIAPLGQVLRTALPAGFTDSSTDFVEFLGATSPPTSPTEAKLVAWLQSRPGPQPVARLRRECGDRVWWPAIRRLEEAGVLRVSVEAPRTEPAIRTRRVLRITRDLPSLAERDRIFGRAARQRECYETLEAAGGTLDTAHLTTALGFSPHVLHGLVGRGVAEFAQEQVARDPFGGMAIPAAPDNVPTPEQAAVIASLVDAVRTAEPGTFLLRGVTGSGKTLVYIELLREVVERQGRTAIVLVPEIALTPQTVGRFRAVFGDRVAVLHSGLSDGERLDEWRSLRAGDKQIVVGARSAVFAPLQNLGAIVVDEEHESSYKQGEAPRYHAREVAVMRAHMERAVCLLGSATPALESWSAAAAGRYTLLELPDRVGGRPLPPIEVVNLRRDRGAPVLPVLSPALTDAMGERLHRGEQTILLLNRRGYATFVQCKSCGAVWHCPQCNVSLTFHRRRARLVCHYCFHEEAAPERCNACGDTDLGLRGVGTEQVERLVGEEFPAARVARMDVDTTSGKFGHHRILERVERGEVDILLGTQMIAKGLDFPNVTLVGVINADVGINLPDFRATERTFQLLTQVAGRAGRGSKGGQVLIQTALPNHYAIASALQHDFIGFAERELEARAEPSYPPFSRLVNVVVSGLDEIAVQEASDRAVTWLEGLMRERHVDEVRVLGPAPCPVDRIRGRWRWHFLLRSRRSALLGEVARYFATRWDLPRGKHDLRVAVDRDPVALL